MSAAYRLNRLFHPRSKRCIDIAVDHGFFGEPRFLDGIEDMPAVVETLVRAGPGRDPAHRRPGAAAPVATPAATSPPSCSEPTSPTSTAPSRPSAPFSLVVDDAIGQAVRLDAACVCVNIFDIPGMDDLRRQCLENVGALRTACDRAGMPLMVEPLVMKPGGGGYEVDGDADRIVALVRQATELGADLVKADPTDDLSAYRRVVIAARVPVLVRGGGRVPDDELLSRTRAVLEQGAAGIVYGRNVIQHPDPTGMVRALRAVVHGEPA